MTISNYKQATRQQVLETEDRFIKEFPQYEKPTDSNRHRLLEMMIGTSVDQGLYIINALKEASKNPGVVCEFGVAQGATSALMANEIKALHKRLYLFDSFEGLPPPNKEKDKLTHDMWKLGSMEKYQGTMKCSKEEVVERALDAGFPIDMLFIVQGFIDKTLSTVADDLKVCFANLDMDLYDPTKLALNWVADRLVLGGMIMVHDVAFFTTGPKCAVNEFKAKYSDKYEYIDRGNQALLIKRSV